MVLGLPQTLDEIKKVGTGEAVFLDGLSYSWNRSRYEHWSYFKLVIKYKYYSLKFVFRSISIGGNKVTIYNDIWYS